MNHHWKAQFHQCHICNLDYKYITHLENNSNEADFIFKKLKIGTGNLKFQRLMTKLISFELYDDDHMI